MSKVIYAIFENGVFRPTEPVDLPEHSQVEFEPRVLDVAKDWPNDYFQRTAGSLAGEKFERPSQGELPERDSW